jgi:hypothetical protein
MPPPNIPVSQLPNSSLPTPSKEYQPKAYNNVRVLEIPAFVIGFAGLTAVYDKVCLVWKTLADAANYGDDIAETLAEVEMEYLKFEMRWSVMVDLVKETRGSQQKARTAVLKGSLATCRGPSSPATSSAAAPRPPWDRRNQGCGIPVRK